MYGTYHLYQPVALVGYTQNQVVHLPKTSCIPLFYLKYAYDAKWINDFEIGLLDIIELGFNLGLNLIGAGEITDLSYLSEISELAEVETLADSTPVLTWDNFLGLNRTVMITAGSINGITQYIAQQADNSDPGVKAFLQTLNEFIGIIALATMAIDATAQIISSTKAQQIMEESTALDESDQLPSGVREEIEEFVGNISELVDLMNTKLAELPNIPSESNTIISKFTTITDPQQQLNFFNDFYFLDDDDPIWVQYNDEYTPNSTLGLPNRTQIDDWIEISYLKDLRSDRDFMNYYKRTAYEKPNEYLHLTKGYNDVGGHTAINVATPGNPNGFTKYLKIAQDCRQL